MTRRTNARDVDRYMYEKVSERSEGELSTLTHTCLSCTAQHFPIPVLDERIDHFGDLVKSYYGIEELGDPSAFTEVRTTFPSMVACQLTRSRSVARRKSSSLAESPWMRSPPQDRSRSTRLHSCLNPRA